VSSGRRAAGPKQAARGRAAAEARPRSSDRYIARTRTACHDLARGCDRGEDAAMLSRIYSDGARYPECCAARLRPGCSPIRRPLRWPRTRRPPCLRRSSSAPGRRASADRGVGMFSISGIEPIGRRGDEMIRGSPTGWCGRSPGFRRRAAGNQVGSPPGGAARAQVAAASPWCT